MTGVLEVWTRSGASLEVSLRTLLTDPLPRIMAVLGPSDAGKTTAWRRVLLHRNPVFMPVFVVDGEDASASPSGLDRLRGRIVVIDHLDRSHEPSTLRAGHTVMVRWIPTLLGTGNRVLLVLNTTWTRRYREMYGTSAIVSLRHANPHHPFECIETRAYTPDELHSLPDAALLPVEMFDDESLRLPGLVSLALEIARETETNPMERDAAISLTLAQALRWINNPSVDDDRLTREALWLHFGARELESASPAAQLPEIYQALGGNYPTAVLREHCRGVFEGSSKGFRLKSALLRTAAGAWFLKHLIETDLAPSVALPISSRVVDATAQLMAEEHSEGFAALVAKLDAFRDQPLESGQQLLVCAIATVAVRLADGDQVDLSGLDLSAGDHGSATPVPDTVRALVRESLVRHLLRHDDGLLSLLQALPADTVSAYQGDPTIWHGVREWAAGLFAHYPLDTELSSNIPPFTSLWRYEDILDDAVTGATTQFMQRREQALLRGLDTSASTQRAALADIWDGINDGVWDRISQMRDERVDALVINKASEEAVLDLVGSRLQRGRLGVADVTRWRFRGADLLLCDMRSCRGLEYTDFGGCNWWDAMLPPHIRYRLSQVEHAQKFRDWCAAPPWSNPYYTSTWPLPLTTGESDE